MDKVDFSGYSKLLCTIGYVTMGTQCIEYDKFFKLCQDIHPDLTEEELNYALNFAKKNNLIEGFEYGYVFQAHSASGMRRYPMMSLVEIMEKVTT